MVKRAGHKRRAPSTAYKSPSVCRRIVVLDWLGGGQLVILEESRLALTLDGLKAIPHEWDALFSFLLFGVPLGDNGRYTLSY